MPKEAIKELKEVPSSVTISIAKNKQTDQKITSKKKVSSIKKEPPLQSPNLIADMLIAMANIMMIVPAAVFGVFIFFSAGFRCGMEAALKMYNDGTESSKKWAVK